MNQMTIDCPSCGSPLLVPQNAAGRKARCTRCETRFVIPSIEEMLEQTISHFALEELDHRYHEHDMTMIGAESSAGRHGPRPDFPSSSQGTVLGVPAVPDRGDPDDLNSVLSMDDLSPPTLASIGVTLKPSGTSVTQPAPASPVPDDVVVKTDQPDALVENDTDEASDPAEDESEGDSVAARYPQELRPTTPRPYLVVREVAVSGVKLAFAAEWLMNEVFRTSMPLRCAFSGKGPEAGLVSRPMIFLNRSRVVVEQARAIELRFEQVVGPNHSPREHVRSISRIDGMHEPFDRPMLYYATANRTSDALACSVSSDERGQLHCKITLPHGEVALDWLSRVNGRCGPEYALLKSAVANLMSDAWTNLPDRVRKRLETWCQFERGERFKLYLNDADLTAADAGLGGVVVTDRRLLHHKFRRSRSLSLKQDATLHIRTDDKFARLTLESHGRLARAGKIHRCDMDKLIQSLADATRLKVTVGRAGPNEPDD